MVKFYPKEEHFPEEILCPICIHYGDCAKSGFDDCKTLNAMCEDMDGA